MYAKGTNGIKRSFFLRADKGIKTNFERLISTDQRTFQILSTRGYISSFELLWNQAINSLRMEWSSNQGWFSPIKILDPSRKCF